MKYDYLIVGAGLFGAVFAHEAAAKGKKCLVIDKRNHIAGNIYTEKIEDIDRKSVAFSVISQTPPGHKDICNPMDHSYD